ncbi:unnamed protein product [Didymodactylos carnosus]|uniref:ATP-grasp domain-containing protein n=1 Tax=Didymodactylos carnosus TaxID=1234261 RepID=A0A813QIU0_9BILA|nr:unnamed protein product [Didymodactylos carnosus]CAF0768581.1 unnamed protein product [Didymodactylos carnosus]CAF3503558.1 unnamed protein product [Didymodactylos carnosus]CAF3550401.1 unnamed protein product [Didymodactylos carnosus]
MPSTNDHYDEEKTVYIIHENDLWIPPFCEAFDQLGLKYVEWNINSSHTFSINNSPPKNSLYFNRISPSSHTRNHRYACEYTSQLLDWLRLHNCRIINDNRALTLELSKVKQYAELKKWNIKVPKTAVVCNVDIMNSTTFDQKQFIQKLKEAAKINFYDEQTGKWTQFITKHNRAGKGLGVHLFTNDVELEKHFLTLFNELKENGVKNVEEELSIDGIYLLQRFIKSKEHTINRAEFIGYKNMYVIQVDTLQGFQLCPSDACRKQQQQDKNLVKQSVDTIQHGFDIRDPKTLTNKENELIQSLEGFLRKHEIEIAGIEYIEDSETDQLYVYDINCNTNYNVAAEKRFYAQMHGVVRLGEYFQKQLETL